MKRIVESKLQFYKSVTASKETAIAQKLREQKISLLRGFVDNIENVKQFYQTYYKLSCNRIVLCGINPGKLGAGKTGVPFIDFKSLSTMLPTISERDAELAIPELSAQFMMSVISYFGINEFFNKVYLTNLSWFGFIKGGKNLNYYKLDRDLQYEFTKGFIEEMEIVQPRLIIPLSSEVEKSLISLQKSHGLRSKIVKRLPHPYYSSFPSRRDEGLKKYIESINKYTV